VRQAGSAQVALVNATQFKSGTLPAGKVVAGDVSGLLVKPTRPWVVSSLSGKALKLALERSLSRAPDANAHFLQVSGLVVRYDPQAPAGARVTDLQIGDAPCQDATRYRVAMPDDLAKGGSGYFTIAEFSEASILPGATGALAEAIAAFLEANATLDYGTATRILTITR
jgi:2',3'-cyclic-nucleotide 2'-phosphodiesterase (5'-nucleotidase family)